MSIRPLAYINPNTLTNVDDALALIDVGLAELMEMSADTAKFSTKDVWTFEKNVLSLTPRYTRLEALIREGTAK